MNKPSKYIKLYLFNLTNLRSSRKREQKMDEKNANIKMIGLNDPN